MEFNNTFYLVLFCFALFFHSIPVSHSQPQKTNYQYVTSTTPPVLVPRLETWVRAMQLSFRSLSEPPTHSLSEFQSQSSGMVAIPYRRGTSESLLPTPLHSIPSSISESINLLDTNLTVNNVCRRTEYPDRCISTVSPFLKENSDISTILDRTMKSTAWLIKLGSIHAQRLSNKSGNPPKDETKILKSCKDNYDNAFSNFQEAMKALACKDLERMNSMLKAVLSEMEDCRDEYVGKTFPLVTYDDKITKMTSNCLAIVDMVHQHH